VLVLVVAVVALHQPHGHVTSAGTLHVGSSSSSHSAAPSKVSKSSASAHEAPATATTASTAAGAGSVKSVPLIVLNNTTVNGLAAQAAQRFESGGWTVTRYGNLTNDILSTCAYYDPTNPQAQAAAEALQAQFPTIKRVEPKFVGLPDGPVVVVLTPGYSAS
jgi:hypothetical protein